MSEAIDTPQVTPQNTPPSEQVSPTLPPSKRRGKFLLILLLLYLIVLAGVGYFLITSQKPPSKTQEKVTVKAVPSLFLTMDHPKDQDSAINGELLVSGKTLPNTTVVMYTDTDETSVESDEQGAFEGTVLLGEDDTSVTITVYAENGDEKTVTLSVSPQSP